MRIPRFYQAESLHIAQDLLLTPENFRHAIQVMRLKTGSPVILFNGEGGEYQATLSEITKRSAKATLCSYDPVNRESPLISKLVLALLKPDKMDFAIQKAVELGIHVIQPVITERSVIHIKAQRLEKKRQHWKGVVSSACEQSGRTQIPKILPPIHLREYLQQPTPQSQRIVMLPTAKHTLKNIELKNHCIELLIGPEGGYSHNEEILLDESAIQSITFGPRILRAETAVIAGLTALQIAYGDLQHKPPQ